MKNRINRITAFVVALALCPVVANAIPVEGPNGNFYEVIAYPTTGSPDKTWDAADAAASGMTHNGISGHLATITSAAEDSFINGLRLVSGSNITGTFPNSELWVGGFQDLSVVCDLPVTANQCGWTWINSEGSFPGTNGGATYANWNGGEPNNAGAGEVHLAVGIGNAFAWNDEGNLLGIYGYVVEYDFSTVFVPRSEEPITFLDGSIDPASPHGVSAGYQEVLEGGEFSIDCCRVLDDREIAGHYRRWWQPWFGNHPTGRLDLVDAVADTATNPTCVGMPVFESGTAIVRSWQRGTRRSRGIPNNTTGLLDPQDIEYREHEIGVCYFQAAAVVRGVLFSEEETENVLGYSINCAEKKIKNRPFTAGATTSVGDTEVDAPFVTPWTAECDGSRSAKRHSNGVAALNLTHFLPRKPTKPYLLGLVFRLQQSINHDICVDSVFLDDLKSDVRGAKRDIQRRRGNAAVRKLNRATRRALLIHPFALEMGDPDPYNPTGLLECPGNPKGLFVGRLMALKMATCSEQVRVGHGKDAKAPAHCAIAGDILNEMPELPVLPAP